VFVDGDRITRVSLRRFERLFQGAPNEAMPECAGGAHSWSRMFSVCCAALLMSIALVMVPFHVMPCTAPRTAPIA